jgi:hypothetical protein
MRPKTYFGILDILRAAIQKIILLIFFGKILNFAIILSEENTNQLSTYRIWRYERIKCWGQGAIYDLQLIDSRIDEIRNVRGELPLEVEDLEDEVAGLSTFWKIEKWTWSNRGSYQRKKKALMSTKRLSKIHKTTKLFVTMRIQLFN